METSTSKNRFYNREMIHNHDNDFSAKLSTEVASVQVKLEKESLLSINAVVTIHNDSHTTQQRMNVVMEKFPALEAANGVQQ